MNPLNDEERQVVELNIGLVPFVLRRRGTDTDEWDDAYQDGLMGLMRAARKFDPTRGIRFSTYAVIWIRQFVQRGVEMRAGKNFRSAKGRGETYVPPLSLDWEYNQPDTAGDGVTLADAIGGHDFADSCDSSLDAQKQLDHLRTFFTDAEWTILTLEPEEAARQLNRSVGYVQNKRGALRRRAREVAAA